MSQNKEHIDKAIKQKLLGVELAPPPASWDSIANALNKKERRAAIVLYRWFGYAAAVLLIGVLSFYFTRSDKSLNHVKDNYSQQITKDSIHSKKDRTPIESAESFAVDIQEKNKSKQEDLKTTQFAQILRISLPDSRAANKITDYKKQVFIAEQETAKETAINQATRIAIESLANLKPAQIPELFSLYKSSFNPLSLFKAYAFKQAIKNAESLNSLADNSDKKQKMTWSVGLAYSPTNVSRSSGFSTYDAGLAYADGSNGSSEIQSGSHSFSEIDLPAYAGGVNIDLDISARWSFKSGLYYLKQGQRIDNFSVVGNADNAKNNTNSYFGNIEFNNINLLNMDGQRTEFVQVSDAISLSYFEADLVQQFELLEIPLLASYKIINRRLIFSLTAGINPGFLIGNHVYLSNHSSESIGKTEAVNTLIYKSVFGLSFDYPLSRKLYFNFSPNFKYQLNNFNKNAIVNERLYYFEFKTGLNYRF